MLHNGFARRVQPFRIAVTLGSRQIADDVDEDLVRGLEAEWRRVADVQFQNFIAFFLKTFRFFQNRATSNLLDFSMGDMNLDLLAVIATPCRGSQHGTMYSASPLF